MDADLRLADCHIGRLITIRLNEWDECKERGWEGDVPPIEGLSLREETSRLLGQVSPVVPATQDHPGWRRKLPKSNDSGDPHILTDKERQPQCSI